ncbi:MAG: FMN-binding protein [Spirochaetes bacterium]|nr:FMN-binding protein [Spirochaetota bacterium]
MRKDGILYTVVFSFIITFLFVFLLALANEGTSGIVQRNQELARQKAILSAMAIPFRTDEEVNTLYKAIEILDKEGVRFYKSTQGGKTIYAKEFSGSGLWGTITGILSVDEQVSQIVGIQIVSHNETPGLGGRVADPWFKDQFRGLKVKNGRIHVTFGAEAGSGKANKEEGIADGITGASRTSQAMDTILNGELTVFKKILGGSR